MMEIVQAVPAGATAGENLNGDWILDRANPGDGLRFRQGFLIHLPTGGLAEDLILDTGTGLRVTASHLIYNALSENSPERAQLSAHGSNGVMVTLPVPRLIHSIRFTAAADAAKKTTKLFRTDGEVVSEEAAASHKNLLVSMKLDSGVLGGSNFSFVNNGPGVMAERVEGSVQSTPVPGVNSAPTPPPGELGITDSRILVRLANPGFVPLSPALISQFNLSTGPENFRIGVRMPGLGDETFFLPVSFALDQVVDAATALAAQMQDLVKRLVGKLKSNSEAAQPPPRLPDTLSIELVFESDAACTFTVSDFAVRYRLRRQSFPDGAPKQVLRFGAGQPQQQAVIFELPSLAQLLAASVEIAGTVAGSEDDSLSATSTFNDLLGSAGHLGLRLDAFHSWASTLTVSNPLLITAWDVLLSPLSAGADLHLELVRDDHGAPAGERLGSARVRAPAGGIQLLRFTLEGPLVLAAGKYWLRLECRDGAAVWLLREQSDSRVIPWQSDSGDSPAMCTGQAGIAHWVVAAGAAGAPPGRPELTLLGQVLPGQRIDGNFLFDLLPALGTATGGSVGSELLLNTLTLLGVNGKPVTVYPPSIEYDISH